ncbi:MAG: polyprenyl synthetase family protein [Clostridiales bacterium]|nr:polyprenyl synthetase family protein [Clostridiales bacterium]
MSNLDTKLNEYNRLVEEKMQEYLSKKNIPEELQKAMAYSVFAGGKRLRPALVLAACELFCDDLSKALPFACAIEFIHTYSLIHDDLPSMDNDDFRRGRLTSHKVFGEDKAILAGDGLLSYAFDIMLDNLKTSNEINAAKYISTAAGVNGMVAGQWIDVSSNGKNINEETMHYIHMNKTAALIIGAIKAGASCGGASNEDILTLENYGQEIGYTFQIIDDILDVVGNDEDLGKLTGSDAANNKTTYVTLFGIEGAQNKAKEHTENALNIMNKYGEKGQFFNELALYLLNRKK